eukprot:1160369-Pelagomonas_calceolata.AAC.5
MFQHTLAHMHPLHITLLHVTFVTQLQAVGNSQLMGDGLDDFDACKRAQYSLSAPQLRAAVCKGRSTKSGHTHPPAHLALTLNPDNPGRHWVTQCNSNSVVSASLTCRMLLPHRSSSAFWRADKTRRKALVTDGKPGVSDGRLSAGLVPYV